MRIVLIAGISRDPPRALFPDVNAMAVSETQQCLAGVLTANGLTMVRGGNGYRRETANGLTMAIDGGGGDGDCPYRICRAVEGDCGRY